MTWKVATFNVNGIRARLPRVLDWIRSHEPDVLCLQEIKCTAEQFPFDAFASLNYVASVHGQKAFHGVAILSRQSPSTVLTGFRDGGPDEEARLIAAEFDSAWVVNTYVPQGRDPADPAFQAKLQFFSRLRGWLESRFRPDQLLVWVGDINVAPEPLDVFDPKRMEGKIGFHPEERRAYERTLSWGFVDVFRRHHPDTKQFTFWDYRIPGSLAKNLGWRLDHILCTTPLADRARECAVDQDQRGLAQPSDHAPVWAVFDR
ncbi:MAG: exodeoxyribonuclease III [Syntrophobacteraceae bacterium]